MLKGQKDCYGKKVYISKVNPVGLYCNRVDRSQFGIQNVKDGFIF